MSRIKTYFYEIALILLSSFPALEPLFHKGIFTAHDIEANIGRFAAFFISLNEGLLLPGWAGYVANGYGSPILLFTYLLPYYLQLPIKMLGFTLTDTAKIYILITYVLSGLFMYFFLRKHVSKPAAFIGALFYLYAPYRINDIYARGSISEQTAFVLIPLVGLVIYELYRRRKWLNVIFLALAIAGLLMSHPFILLISGFFYGYYVIYLNVQKRWQIDRKFLIYLAGGGFIALGLCAFFLLPLALENKYLHYNINPLNLSWSNQAVPFLKLLKPEWTFIDITGKMEYQTWQIGLLHIVTLVTGLIIWFWKKFKNKFLLLGIVTSITGIFFQLSISRIIYANFSLLQQIQFPWRFMSLTVIGISLMAAGVVNELKFPKKTFQLWIFSVLVIGALLALNLPYAKGHGYQEIPDHYYNYELKDNTEGISTTPIWADAPEKYKRAHFLPQTTLPADISYIYRNSGKHIYLIRSDTQNMVIDNTFYFPNWQVFVDRQLVIIEFQNPDYRGLMTFQVPPGEHLVEVIFSNTKLRRLSKIITALSWGAVVLYLIYFYKKRIKIA